MASELELAAFAENVYRPQDENIIQVPGWAPDDGIPPGSDRGYGFDAAVFEKNDHSEIVVAFRGTDFGLDPRDWLFGNVDAAFGSYSEQVMRAIEFMADVLAAHPGKTITLTGHSLGGGLASLMAAFFDKKAFVFAPAPFENTALGLTAVDIVPGPIPGYVRFETDVLEQYVLNYVKYQNDRNRLTSAALMAYGNTFVNGSEAEQAALFAARQQRVTGMYLEGEVVSAARVLFGTVIDDANFEAVDLGTPSEWDAVSLHSMTLHAVLNESADLATAARQLPKLLAALWDENLYSPDRRATTQNFLVRLINDRLATTSQDLIGKFATDLLRLGEAGTTHMAGLTEGIIATIIERYYFADPASTDSFLQQVGNGIRFDVSTIEGSDKRGQTRLLDGLQSILVPEHRALARDRALQAPLWTVQSGANGLTTSGDSRNEVQIGSISRSNTLEGGGGHDLLINGHGGGTLRGGDGNDVLLGGNGNDTLEGSAGVDEYRFATGDGSDTVAVETSGVNCRRRETQRVRSRVCA